MVNSTVELEGASDILGARRYPVPMTSEATATGRIELEAVRKPIAEIAGYLQEHLGQRPTAYLSGLENVKSVGKWAAGKVTPRAPASLRLRHAYHAARLLIEAFGDETAKAWLFGINRELDDEAPAVVLRYATEPEDVTPVVRAARSFAESAYGSPPTEGGQAQPQEIVLEEARRFARVLAHEIRVRTGTSNAPGSFGLLKTELVRELRDLDLEPSELERGLGVVVEDLKDEISR